MLYALCATPATTELVENGTADVVSGGTPELGRDIDGSFLTLSSSSLGCTYDNPYFKSQDRTMTQQKGQKHVDN